jgi:hypothetical protein
MSAFCEVECTFLNILKNLGHENIKFLLKNEFRERIRRAAVTEISFSDVYGGKSGHNCATNDSSTPSIESSRKTCINLYGQVVRLG